MKKIICLLVSAIVTLSTLSTVTANPLPNIKYTQFFKEDRGNLTKRKCEAIEKKVSRMNLTAGKIYKKKNFKVMLVSNMNDRKKAWNLLEKRKQNIVIVSIGRMYNTNGDGKCTDGTYTGYRYDDGNKRRVMNFSNVTWIKTIEIFPGNNQYIDCIAYRSDVPVDIR